jgi:hypothetical protein
MASPNSNTPIAESRWRRFSKDWLLACIIYPVGALISFYSLSRYSDLDLLSRLVLTFPITLLIGVAAFFAFTALPFYASMPFVAFVIRFRRHPRIRPFYLRCRERSKAKRMRYVSVQGQNGNAA